MIYRTNMMSTQGVPLCSMPFLCCCARRSQDFKTCRVEDSDEPDVGDAPVAILAVVSDDAEKPVHFNPIKISIVLESEVMVTNLPRLADAFLVMFGLIYALHLSYPKELANTFEFVQKILLGLEDGTLKRRLQALKNDLLIHV
ncbi:uncharacterized protein LOC131733175 isoform X5 [Acipenser ruthenus]|uniref:uncharacterized protein LOC131733175 isoform X5 n=1 Tax=Acipenser ruthenus TaxID=7906 RepID=UPI0027410DA3|nr:uncharacterized protein LOC131733175 isoform X5 [Acipenser ruthenus]XP_058877117.1 uncharacterized protein LOC131733175 isoform X5 [Acipenser ruthenus]XP_058877118.1 uncharacterized protein LOC131733175 isoform X5 [Acipenser ruthenus]